MILGVVGGWKWHPLLSCRGIGRDGKDVLFCGIVGEKEDSCGKLQRDNEARFGNGYDGLSLGMAASWGTVNGALFVCIMGYRRGFSEPASVSIVEDGGEWPGCSR